MAKSEKKDKVDKKDPSYKDHMKAWESKKDKNANKALLDKVPGKYLKFNEILKGEN